MPFEPSNTIPWPSNPAYGSAASFGRTVIGKFSSASVTDLDAVIVAGGVAVHSRTTASYKLLEPITFPDDPGLTDVVDVAVLPGAGPLGTDALLATDSRGLLKTGYVVNLDPPGFSNPEVLEGTDWVDAGPIHVVDADEQGGLDIVGVAAGGTAVLTLVDSGGSFVPGAFIVPSTVMDVVVSNWDSDPENEYVVLTVGGLFIHALAGTRENVVPYSATAGAIDRVTWPNGEGGRAEFIAWGRPKTSGGGELVVLNRNVNEGALTLSVTSCQSLSFVPKAILAGHYNVDYNGTGTVDPYDDLLLVHEVDRTAVVLVNQGGGPQHFSLDPACHDVIPLGQSSLPPAGVGVPAFEQIDGVGPEDLAFPVRVTGKVQVFLNANRFNHPDAQGGQPPMSSEVVDDQYVYDPNDQIQPLLCAIQKPGLFADYPQVQVILWKEDDAPVGVSDFVDRRIYTFFNGGSYQYAAIHGFPIATFWPEPGRDYYYLEIRFKNGTSLSPRYFAGLTLRETDDDEPHNYQHLFVQGVPPLLALGYDDGSDQGVILGAYIPMNSSPAFVDGQQPSLPPPVNELEYTTPFNNNPGT